MQVHPIQLLSHRYEARLDADAPWKTDTLSRGTASDRGHALHYDLFRRSVIESPTVNFCKLSDCDCIKNVLPPYDKEYQKEKVARGIKEKYNLTFRRVHCCRLETSIATDGLNSAFNREM